MERRLAAILAADIAGYSRLMGEDEEATVRALQGHHASIRPIIKEHGGRLINTAGDSMLAEFASVVGAVSGAAAIQKLLTERNKDLPASRRLEFRIGVNQGEIVVDQDDVYGDGINVAARLQALAKPGGIAISGRVHEDVAGKLVFEWQDTGEQSLKNIARPVRVWQWSEAGEPRPPTLPLPERPSIAVLPFDNLSGQQEDTYFSDGITEDIITGLARFRSLFVVARNSSFAFRGQSIDLADNRRAVVLNPNDADRRMALGYLLALRGRLDEALEWMQEAMRLNPFYPTWYNARLGVLYYSMSRYAEAAQAFRQIPTPGYWSRTRLAACHAQLGQTAEAELQKAVILREKPDFSIADFFTRDVLLERAEDRELLREGMVNAGLPG